MHFSTLRSRRSLRSLHRCARLAMLNVLTHLQKSCAISRRGALRSDGYVQRCLGQHSLILRYFELGKSYGGPTGQLRRGPWKVLEGSQGSGVVLVVVSCVYGACSLCDRVCFHACPSFHSFPSCILSSLYFNKNNTMFLLKDQMKALKHYKVTPQSGGE